jgi:hypothetical protein
MKIIIIGGGISGLSAATILADIPNIDISIYEKEAQIGGQAASIYSETCNIEYSWRIYGAMYHNLMYIFKNKLQILDNFKKIENNCFIEKDTKGDSHLDIYTMFKKLLNTTDFNQYYKITDILFLHKDRFAPVRVEDPQSNWSKTDYDINALEHFDKNPIIQTILGPYLGMDANKVSYSGAMKNLYACSDNTKYSFTPTDVLLTKQPTSDDIFNHWETYLKGKGVKIFKNSEIHDIHINENKIDNIHINNNLLRADEYVFACSLRSINHLFNNKYSSDTFDNMKLLESDLQLYFTINIYFSEKITNTECEQQIIVDMPWKPIIQRKLSWSKSILDNCRMNNKQIQEVWNVGFLDYNVGKYNNKILRNCSIQEAIEEGILQVKNSEYVKSIIEENNRSFDDIYIGCEHWYQFKNDTNNKLISTNPKFSINVGTMKKMPTIHATDIPENMVLCGYYVDSTIGGVSMEASCETGLNAGKKLIEKYNLPYNDILPIKHTTSYMSIYTLPFVYLDKVLLMLKLPSIIYFVNSFYLLVCYILFLFFVFILCFYYLFSLLYNHKLRTRINKKLYQTFYK